MNQLSAGRAAFSNTIESLESRRLMAAGTIDSTFTRVAQSAPLDFDAANAEARDIVIDNAGRALIFGNWTFGEGSAARRKMFVARFAADSRTPDLSFGTLGVQIVDVAAGQDAKAIAVDHAGRINLAYNTAQGGGTMMQLAQLSDSGALNRRFGKNGTTFPRFGPDSHVTDLAIDSQNNIVFVANAANQIGVGKLSPTGRQHPDFGARSTRFIPSTAGATAAAIAVDAKDELLVGATLPGRTTSDFGVIKLRTTGLLQTAFGRKGFAGADIAGGRDQVDGLFIDTYGRIVLTGKRAYAGAGALAAAARFTADGLLDPKFYKKGVADGTKWAVNADEIKSLSQPFDSKPVLAVDNGEVYNFFVGHHSLDVTYAARRWSESIDSTEPNDFMFTKDIPNNIDVVAVAGRGKRISYAVFGGGDPQFGGTELNTSFSIGQTWDDSYEGGAPLRLPRVADDAEVLANGKLAVSLLTASGNKVFLVKPDSSLDTAFGGDGFADEVENTESVNRPYRLVPRSDGSFWMVLTGQTITAGDSIAMLFFRVSSNADVKFVGFTGTENHAEYATALSLDHMAFGYQAGEGGQSGIGFLKPDGSSQGMWFSDGEDVENFVPGPPLFAVPIQGTDAEYVTGYDAVTGNGYLSRIDPDSAATPADNFVTTFSGTPIWGQPSGQLLYTRSDTSVNPGLRRLNADGTPDNTFGTSGVMAADLGPDAHFMVDSKGRIVAWRQFVGGVADGDIQIARYSQNGKVDTTFGGGDGIMVVDTRTSSAYKPNLIVDGQDRLIVTTVRTTTSGVAWSAVRVLGD